MSDTLVAAYDGSAASRRAVDFALAQARTSGARLVLAHVLEWSPYSFLTPDEVAERHRRRKDELDRAQTAILGPLLAELAGTGVAIETDVRFGHIAETLAAIAREQGASQMVVGRTGESSVMARIFGATVGTLAQIAPVPCTIVP
ncbi:MAG: universal stress protein [Rhodobacteraceae bacterium]|jgi:nucleotide-binding universal stress UspA family protein|nr:universal stress protein [Paracoccaceae bacterium]